VNVELIARIVGTLVVGYLGWNFGFFLRSETQLPHLQPLIQLLGESAVLFLPYLFASIGAVLGASLAPHLTTRPFIWVRNKMRHVAVRTLAVGIVGLVVGLVISALLALPLSILPAPFGTVMPFVAALLCSYFGVLVMVTREKEILGVLGLRLGRGRSTTKENSVLVDTSVIIDGRLADVSKTGFISGTLLIPRFILNELQHIADSSDGLRRNRGRRGLDMLNKLQEESLVPIRITEMDVKDVHEVDQKLIRLATELGCPIVTNDYNLNRVAKLQGIKVLNINELANAVKAVVLPGETITIRIIQEGKELGQGVGYLDDGTMVVVEDGRRHIDHEIEASVTRVLQTVAGRMIFARPRDRGERAQQSETR